MKKLLSTLIVITLLAFTAFADGHADSPGIICEKGHADSPGKCPTSGFAAESASTTYLETLFADYNPFAFFLD